MRRDCRGLEVTGRDAHAVAALDCAIDAFARHAPDVEVHLSAALNRDPELVLAHLLRGYAAALMQRARWEPVVGAALASARLAMAAAGATPRETLLLYGLEALRSGRVGDALVYLDASLARAPVDLLTAKLAHGLRFMIGDSAGMAGQANDLLARWPADAPGRANLMGMAAFAACETGDPVRAEALGRAAVDEAPTDWWAVHAVAHVLETDGRPVEGRDWIAAAAADAPVGSAFRRHLQWHGALFDLARGDLDAALARHDSEIWSDGVEEYRCLANAISLLWRIEDAGGAVGGRWQALVERSIGLVVEGRLAFAALHGVLGLAAAGQARLATQLASRYAERVRRGAVPRDLNPTVAADLALALVGEGAGAGSVAAILSIGGSRPQRALFVRHARRRALHLRAA